MTFEGIGRRRDGGGGEKGKTRLSTAICNARKASVFRDRHSPEKDPLVRNVPGDLSAPSYGVG